MDPATVCNDECYMVILADYKYLLINVVGAASVCNEDHVGRLKVAAINDEQHWSNH